MPAEISRQQSAPPSDLGMNSATALAKYEAAKRLRRSSPRRRS